LFFARLSTLGEIGQHLDWSPVTQEQTINEEKNIETLDQKIRRGSKRLPFKPEQIVDLYTRAAYSFGGETLGATIAISMYSGCGIEEIFQIKIKNIDFEANSFTSEGREMVIHPRILPLFKSLAAQSENEWLLPSTTTEKKAGRSASVGKRFGRLKKRMKFNSRFVFQSIGKCVATLENIEYPAFDILIQNLEGDRKLNTIQGTDL